MMKTRAPEPSRPRTLVPVKCPTLSALAPLVLTCKGLSTDHLTGAVEGGAPWGLTSQLRSLSLVTVRSAKSPRLTSPPPIVSMMKTSEEKPKEPGGGRGGRRQRGARREAERGRER